MVVIPLAPCTDAARCVHGFFTHRASCFYVYGRAGTSRAQHQPIEHSVDVIRELIVTWVDLGEELVEFREADVFTG